MECKANKIYAFSNEKLRAYLPLFNVKGKVVATVTGSGDHPLNLVLLGAKKVVHYDTQVGANHWFELKRAGVRRLDLEEFIEFFVGCLRNEVLEFDEKVYADLRGLLAHDTAKFWDDVIARRPARGEMFSAYYYAGLPIKDSHEKRVRTFTRNNMYLNEGSYYKLRRRLKGCDLSFLNKSLLVLPQEVDDKFDAIFTSNIHHFVNDDARYAEFVKTELPKLMNPGAKAQVEYRFGSLFSDFGAYFNDERFSKVEFASSDDDNMLSDEHSIIVMGY